MKHNVTSYKLIHAKERGNMDNETKELQDQLRTSNLIQYYDKQHIFESQIKPLIEKLQKLAIKHDLPLVVSTEFFADSESYGTHLHTHLDPKRASDRMIYAMLVLDPEVDLLELVKQLHSKLIMGQRDTIN